MKADSNEAAIETLEIRHQGIDLSLEMMTPMAGFFGGSDSEDLSSPEPHEGAPNGYYDLTTGGPTEKHEWHANDFVKITPREDEEAALAAAEPAKPQGPNFWDMAPYGPSE